MRIGIDIRPLQTGSKYRGVGYYIHNLVENLLAMDAGNEYFLFYFRDDIAVDFREAANCRLCPLELKRDASYGAVTRALNEHIERYRIDIFVNTSPFEWNVKMSRKYRCRSVAILYDLIPVLFYNQYLHHSPGRMRDDYFCTLASLRNYDRLLSISECTKRDACELLEVREDRIDVIFGGVSSRFRPSPPGSVPGKYHITGDYFLCTGGFDYRKNLETLIRSFGAFCRENDDFRLVIVCRLLKPEEDQLQKTGREAGVPPGRLILTNFVPDDDLVALYNGSSGVVFPSLYEGFGLPVAEGMACGKAVITSATSSMPEVIRDAGMLVDPRSEGDITKAMLTLARDKPLREELGRKGLALAQDYGWDRVASRVLKSLTSLQDSILLPEKILSGKAPKLKIACFTPLSPEKSGIADYSEELIPQLLKYAAIDIFIDDYKPASRDLVTRCGIYSHREFDRRAAQNGYDAILYQMGNSLYHEYMYPYIERYPGVVVLHDFSLQGFIYATTHARGCRERYLEEMRFSHGDAGEIMAMRNINSATGPDVHDLRYPVNRRVLYRSKGVLVHSEWARDMLAQHARGVPVGVVNMGIGPTCTPPAAEEISRQKRSLGMADGDVVFASFGFIASTKRILQSLKAFARLAKEVPGVKYLLAGEVSPDMNDAVAGVIAENGISDKVILTGYLTKGDFDRLLSLADVGINLRYPTSGESSSSLAKLIGAGKPVIVSRIGAFREFPDDFCWKADVDMAEEDLLYEYMKALALDEKLRKDAGDAALAYAEKYFSCAAAAERYVQFLALVK